MQMLDGPRFDARSEEPAQKLIVLLHGYGADGKDLIELAKIWGPLVPDAAFVAPDAPDACSISPTGRQWFDLSTKDPHAYQQGVMAVAPALNKFIDHEVAQLKIKAKDVLLAGFSQGAMMALHVGLRRAIPPAGILSFAGRLISPHLLEKEIMGTPPVCLIHGEDDEVVPIFNMVQAEKALRGFDIELSTLKRPGLAHNIDEESVHFAGKFIKGVFADD